MAPKTEPAFDLPAPGDVVAGKYRVERVIGRGGMGVVVAAHAPELDERVALKFLLPDGAGAPRGGQPLRARGARRGASIQSEHVAARHRRRQLEAALPYIVMEYLEGTDLSALLARRAAAGRRGRRLHAPGCEAMREAHALGIVHRDLKPANLFRAAGRTDGFDQGARLRHLEGAARRRTARAATATQAMRLAPLHVARADRSRRRRRRAHRHLGARRHPVRAAHGQGAVRGRHAGRDDRDDAQGTAPAARDARPGVPEALARSSTGASNGSRPALRDRGRARRRARAVRRRRTPTAWRASAGC